MLAFRTFEGSGSGDCVDPRITDFYLDDIELRSEPACTSPAYVVNGDFERSGTADPWLISQYGGTATFVVPAGRSRSLRLGVDTTCADVKVTSLVSVPPPEPLAGPALKMKVDLPGVSGSNPTYSLATAFPPKVLYQGALPIGSWTQHVVCINPKYTGEVLVLTLSNTRPLTAGNCGVAMSEESVLVDDVELGTHASCPSY